MTQDNHIYVSDDAIHVALDSQQVTAYKDMFRLGAETSSEAFNQNTRAVFFSGHSDDSVTNKFKENFGIEKNKEIIFLFKSQEDQSDVVAIPYDEMEILAKDLRVTDKMDNKQLSLHHLKQVKRIIHEDRKANKVSPIIAGSMSFTPVQ